MPRLLLLALSVFIQPVLAQGTLQEFKFSGAADLVLPQYLGDESHSDSQLILRGVDLMFYGPIDPYFDARLTLAGHEHDGEMHIDVHEAYVSSSKVLPYSRFSVGKFLFDIGRLNTFHQHDWPFTTAPLIHRAIFGDENVGGLGVQYTFLAPTERFFELTIGAANGDKWGETYLADSSLQPESDNQPDFPIHYIHPKTFFEFGEGRGLMLGATALRRWHPADQDVSVFGIDATFKAREGKTLRWLLQSELWSENTRRPGATNGKQSGGYIYAQYGFLERWSTGLRFDTYEGKNVISYDADTSTSSIDSSKSFAVVPNVALKISEMSLLRASYTHEEENYDVAATRVERKFELQFVYILGSHPVHDF